MSLIADVCAVHSQLRPGQAYTTLELKVAYHKALTDQTGPLRAEGRVLSMGRRRSTSPPAPHW